MNPPRRTAPRARARALLVLTAALALPASAAPSRKMRGEPPPETPILEPAVPLHPPRVSTEPITFIWPPEGMVLAAENEFVFGSVADASAHFEINGTTVAVHKDGGFLAWLPISAGTFTFHAELDLSSGAATADRRIFVPPAPVPLPDGKPAIDPASLFPKENLELRAGDWWIARMKATRGKSARLRVGGGPWQPMREVSPRLGLYEAVLQVSSGDEFGPAPIDYQVGSGWSSARMKGTALVSAASKPPAIATVKPNAAGFANMKTAPSGGFLLFPLPGTRMAATGRDGDSIRLEVGPGLSGWLDAKDVELTTGAAPPRAETGSVGVTETPAGASVRIGLSERVPFDVVEGDALDALVVRVYSAFGHTNVVTFDGGSEFVDQVRWRQESTGVVAFTIRLKAGRKLWGWNARYDGASLHLDLRRPPRVNPRRPLAGLRIMLDPGHMPSAPGAIGPLGTKEMDANYAIAQAAAERLTREGAIVLLTRGTTTDEVSLVDRPKQAVERGADLFVSLHNNALPDGTNPFAKARGFTVYYYHPHSLALARAVHAAYAERVTAVADEGLDWDNLLVARLSAVPAILVENAYMILPEQEALLNDPAFRAQLADALVAGLRAFALESGEKEERPR